MIHPASMVRRGAALFLLFALGAFGCAKTGTSPGLLGVAPPRTPAPAPVASATPNEPVSEITERLPLRVGVVSAARTVRFTDANGQSQEIATAPGFLERVRAGLAGVFTEVTVIAREDSRAVDVVVIANIGAEPGFEDYLSRTGLVFQDATSGETIVELKHAGLARRQTTPGAIVFEPDWYGAQPEPIGYEPPEGSAIEKAQRLVDVYAGVVAHRLVSEVKKAPAIRKIVAQKGREAEDARKDALRRAEADRQEALRLAELARKEAALVAIELRGDAAERKGDRAAMLEAWTEALQAAPVGSDVDLRVRERYLAALAALGALPPVPDDAQRHMVRGKVLFQEAKSKADYSAAIDEMQKAVAIAPWWDLVYFNVSLALEGAERFREGARFLRLYLHAAPGSPDAAAARTRMFEMDFKADRAGERPIRVPEPAVAGVVTAPTPKPEATPTPRPATNMTAAPVPSAMAAIVCRTCRDSVPRDTAVSHQRTHSEWSRRTMFGPEVFSINDTKTAGIERHFNSPAGEPPPGQGAPLAGTIKGSPGFAIRVASLPRRSDLGSQGAVGSLAAFYRESSFTYARPDEGTKVRFVEWGLAADGGVGIVATPYQSPVRAMVFAAAGVELDFPQINGLAADYANNGSHRPYYRASMLVLATGRAGVIVNEHLVLSASVPYVIGDTSYAFSQYDRGPQIQAALLFYGGKK